ncbi:MAG: hypothetical protein JWO46_132 [Nocardioidaceae bacterium]|nr:hypothetical protein [Nocardioidaceae bacterium]
MPRPTHEPIGSALAKTAKAVSRAFDVSLAEAGGSRPVWLVLIALRTARAGTQRELARSMDIQGATLSHHLDGMEAAGLVTRRRDPDNRRVHLVETTDAGEEMFHRLRGAATAHDRRIRADVTDEEAALVASVLARMRSNVSVD